MVLLKKQPIWSRYFLDKVLIKNHCRLLLCTFLVTCNFTAFVKSNKKTSYNIAMENSLTLSTITIFLYVS